MKLRLPCFKKLSEIDSLRMPHSTDGFIVRRACPELAEGVGRHELFRAPPYAQKTRVEWGIRVFGYDG